MDDGSDHKKAKGTKKCVIKQKLMFENYKDCLFDIIRLLGRVYHFILVICYPCSFHKTVYRSEKIFKSYYHDVYTEEVNKIALSNNDDKRLQTFDGITTYPYGTNALKVCESEMLMVKDLFFEKLQ